MKYSEYKKRKKEEESGKKSNQTSSRNYSSFTQYKEGQKFGLDTFESDLQSMGNTINGIYGGWQTAETMQNTRDSVVSMQSRINAYQNYQSKYGGKDLSDLEKGYQTVLDDWDKLTSAYGNYQNADAYNNAVKKAKFDNQFNGLTYDEVQSKKKEYAKDSDEYKYLEEYINYTDLNDFDKALSSISEDSDYKKKLQTNRNQYALDNTFDSYKNYMDKDDFAEKSQYVPSKGKDDAWWQDTSDDTYEFINDVDGARSRILGKHDKYQANAPVYTPSSYVERGLGAMNEEEIAVYNYIYATEGKEQAEQFLTDMEVTLTKRATDKASDSLAEELDGNVPASIAFSLVSPLLNVGGGIYGSVETVSSMLSGEEANPYSVYYGLNNDASTIRDTVGQNIAESTEGMELFGQNVPSFLYQTGMSIADSAVGALSFGKALSPLMGTNAYQQKTKELKEAGASEEEVARGAIASGAFEMVFEYASVDKLLKIKDADSFGKIVKESLKQAGIEGSEEMFTEIANVAWDTWNRQDSSDIAQKYQDYLDQGFTEEEAKQKVAMEIVGQVGWAGIGGALSGGAMGSAFSVNNYSDLSSTGKQIRANDRVQEMIGLQDLMEIQGLTPEQSRAYALYSEYAQKGVNADTISNAQLGNLYQTSFREADATIKSRKATQAQKTDANKRLESLDVIATSRPANERARQQRVASLNRGDVTEVTATGNATTIEGIKIDDGNTIVLTSEGEVKAEDMTFSSKDAEILAYAENMGEEKGSLLLAQYDGKADVDTFANSFELAYSYGESQMGLKKALEKCGNLSISQVTEIYEAGRYEKVNKRQNRLNAITEKYVAKHFYKGTIDESVIDRNNSGKGEVNWKDLGETQKETVEAINLIFTGLGINGKWTTKGKEGGYNGYYSRKDDAIVLDVYAGMDNLNVKDMNLAIVSTASHELTHWMETKAPSTFAKLKDHVFESLAEKDGLSDVDRIENEKNRIKEQMIKNNRKVVEVTDEYAISEIVARACEDMLAMSDMSNEALSRLSEKERKTIFTKVKEILQDMIDYISEILGQFKSQSKEAVKLRENQDRLKEQLKLWEQAMKEAVAVNQSLQAEGITGEEAINAVTENVGVTVDLETESAYPSEQLSERTWTESEYVQNRSKAIEQLSKALNVSKEEAGKYIDDINSVARLIADDRARLDYEPNLDEHATVVKPNSEYTWSVNMSTLCAKRLLFTGTFDEIQRQLPNTALDSDDIVNIRAMMKEAKHEVACGICYVESTRREIGTITNEFIERYKIAQKTGKPITRLNSSGKEVELVEKGTKAKFYAEKGYTPTLAELNTTDIDLVKRDHPAVYGAYLSYMNARGQAKPKLLETRAEYKGEILRHFKAKSAVKARNDAGGLRLQSFSDFETPHLIDMMQIITDMSRVGLKSQAYTKVANFAEAFGDTGVKINLSLIAKDSGLDADGNLIFDDVEGINHEDAFRIRDKYSKNVGTILVGKNDAHIIRAMADSRIDYIIPFHKSSWKESLYDALGLTGYDDYTASQNEKPIDKTRKIKNFDPSEYWDFSKSGEENAQIYLEKCKEDGRVPKFPQFQGYEGYWKLLIDFKMYDNDGVGSPQTTVTPNFNMEECNRILNEYKGGHRNFPVAKDVVKKFVSEYKKNHPQEQYSDREFPNNAEEIAKEHFGTTNKWSETGYLLKDGTQLDFSGRHWTRYPEFEVELPESFFNEKRDVEHYEIAEAFPEYSDVNDMGHRGEILNSFIMRGNIRVVGERTVELYSEPTEEQYVKLMEYFSKNLGRSAYVGIGRKDGLSFDSGTNASVVIEGIRNYFSKNVSRQSELMMFHTMYSDREIDSWLYDLSIDDLLELFIDDDTNNSTRKEVEVKKERSKRRVDEVNKRLKQIGLSFNGTKSLAWTDERIDKYLSGGYYGSSNPNYAQAYIGYITPQQFLNLTVGGKNTTLDMILNESESYGEVDFEKLGNSIPIFLEIKEEKNGAKVTGHEGRHRMYLLGKAGFERIPVLFFDYRTKYDKTYKSELKLTAQRYNDTDLISKSRNVVAEDLIPFSQGNRDLIIERFGSGNKEADIRFSDRDSEGTLLSDEQVEFFKDSKVRDENGNLQVMYHGTPNGEFYVFDRDRIGSTTDSGWFGRGFYFTKKESVAKRYAGYLKSSNVKKVYLNVSNPFVIDYKVSSENVFSTLEYITGTYADSFREMTANFTKWLIENGYDGVIAKRSNEVMVLNSNQIKLIDNHNPTKNDDIRFSDRDNVSVYDAMGETERLIDENQRLSEDIATLKRTISADEVNIKRFRSLADYLKKLAGSQYDRETLGDELKELYTYIQTTDNLQWNNVMAKAYDTARRMMNLNPNVSMNYFREVMADIRKDKVTLSADQRAEAEKMFGSYGDFHKAMFGRVNIVTGGTSLEQMWKEWSQKYPAIFKADLSAVEQVEALVDITNALKATSSMMGEYEREEAIRHLATEIYNQFWNVASDSSDAVRGVKASHRKLMEDLRKEYEQRQKEKTLHPVGETALKYEKLLRKVMQKDKAEIKKAKELGKKRLDEFKDRTERNAKIKSITAKALTLNQWLTKNSKDEHIPEIMKAPVVYLLNAIDFSSKQLLGMRGGSNAGMATKRDISLSKALEQVHDMVQKINSAQIGEDEITEIYGTFADFPAGFADDIRELSSIVNDVMRTVGDNAHVLNQMSLEELETLDRIITIIKATATKMNKFLAIRHAEGVANLSQQSINYMDSLGKGKTHEGIRGKVDKLLDWGNALPYYTFKRFGEGGQKVYEALQNGWDTFAFHVKEIIDYADSVYTSKEVKEWSETVKEFDILEPATDEEKASADYEPTYQKVKMSVPQIMSLYCLQKREQAKSHLMGGGMRISDIETKKGIVTQSEGVILTYSEIDMIVESLTDRQRAVADELQKFMNTTCTDWGNEVSMLRFGFKAFGEENYFPIQSDKNNLAVNDETEQNNSLFRLLNMSFTKGTIKKANNRIVISDIFDVFAQHTSDMAKYNALALPVLDSFKWYNYKEKIKKGDTAFTTKSLKQSMENAFSKDAQNYFVTFLKDINGEQSAGRDVVGGGFFTNAKLASVGFNMRVVALQPTSYVRASAVIDNKYLAKAFIHKPKIAMAEKHCGIALWKSLGFYDINIQNSVTDMIKGNQTVKDKIADASMKGAEIADKVTWGYLWNACELEIRDKRKDLRVGSEEFYEAIGKRLREIIYSTQVVDSTMTRSHMMRSKDGKDKMLTAFMSEPTLSYNMLQDCYFDWKLTERQTGSKQTAFKKHGKKMARVITAYTVTNMLCALVESGFDIFRDDDDEMTPEDFIKLYLKNFASDMSILNKIPYAKEVVSMLQGYSSSRTDTQWMQYMTYTITGIGKLIAGEGNVYTTAKNAMRGFSQMTGLPLYNAWRDVTALLDKTELLSAEELEEIFNDTIGSIFPSLKSK